MVKSSIFRLRTVLMLLSLLSLATSCIDEDLSKCGSDYKIVYRMNLRTNINVEIAQTLTTPEELAYADVLRQHLSGVFSDYAYDNDLSFYAGPELFHNVKNKMGASTASYTIYLQRQDYRHLALANTGDETQVSVSSKEHVQTLALEQLAADTIDSHHFGIFSARRDIKAADFGSDIDVNLYMQNCAAAVVIDRRGHSLDDVFGYVEDMSTGFAVSDSLYTTSRHTVVRARRVSGASRSAAQRFEGLAAVCFPSTADTWRYTVVVRRGNTYTKNVLKVSSPLKAGQLRILKFYLKEDGSLTSVDHTVGVSVELNWKPAGEHNVEI